MTEKWLERIALGWLIFAGAQSPGGSPLDGLKAKEVDVRRAAANQIRLGSRDLQRSALPLLIEILAKEKDGQVRLAALDAVTTLGPEAEAAVPALIQTLRSNYGGQGQEESHQDYRSALALAKIGKPSVDELRRLLKERKESVRAEVIMALGRIGPDASNAVDDLIPFLGDNSARLRLEASKALGAIGPASVDRLILACRSTNILIRESAVESLGFLSQADDRARQVLFDAALDASPQVRAAAIRSFARLRSPDEFVLPVIRENLGHDDERVRLAVLELLVDRPSLRQRLAPEFEVLLTSSSAGVAKHAASLLGMTGKDAIARLIAALRRPNCRVEAIAEALAQIGRPAVVPLSEVVEDPDPRVRRGAILALGQIRPLASMIPDRLTHGLADSDAGVRLASLVAVGQLGPKASGSISPVRVLLRDQSPEIRGQAIEVLFQLATRDDRLADDLSPLIDDADPNVQRRAIDAVRALGPSAHRSLPAVISRLRSPDPEVRLAAARLVESQGNDAVDAISGLIALLGDTSVKTRMVAAQTLGHFGKAAQPAFPALTQLLDDDDPGVREVAISAVVGLELGADSLRPLLAKALRDEKPEVRRSAARAVTQLGDSGVILVPDIILMAAKKENQRSVDRLLRNFERTGPDPRSITELVALLDHEQSAVRLLAIKFLGLAGPKAKNAIPMLEKRLQDPDADVRRLSQTALDKIRKPS